MLVSNILSLKGSNTVETITPDASVAEAASVLAARRIGAVVVSTGDGNISGILSERDIVRALAREAGGCLTMSVSALMTAGVETCSPAESSDSLLERMTSGRFRHMPVVEDGRMVGLLSIGDVVKARIEEIVQENAAMAGMLSG